jgi:L-rhamnonate dehydratase
MNRREFTEASAALSVSGLSGSAPHEKGDHATFVSLSPLTFRDQESKLRITGVRMVHPRPKKPMPSYEPAPGSWSTGGALVANPMSIYPKYRARRDSFMADDLGPDAVEITANKGIKGIGFGGPGCSYVIERHLTKLLIGEDPFNVEMLWDMMWRSTLYYGRKGLVIHALSAVDMARPAPSQQPAKALQNQHRPSLLHAWQS